MTDFLDDLDNMPENYDNPMPSIGNVGDGPDTNLIQTQIDTTKILADIERYIRGERVIKDEHGNDVIVKPTDPELITFNEYGVNLLMRTIRPYLSPNTILSIYSTERIYEILFELGDVLGDVIFFNYGRMGMDTNYKRSQYTIIITTVLNTIESVYRRSINGKTLQALNESRIVNQNETIRNDEPVRGHRSNWLGRLSPSNWI